MSQADNITVTQEGDTKVIAMSPSAMDRFQSCELAHAFAKVEKIQPVDKSYHLERGTVFHKILELHYKLMMQGVPYTDITRLVRERINVIALKYAEMMTGELIEQIKQGYIKYAIYYATDPYKPVAVEQPYSYLMFERPGLKVLSEGKIDLVVEDLKGNLIVWDHKAPERQGKYSALQSSFRTYSLVTGCKSVVINEVGFQKEPILRRVVLNYDEDAWQEYKEVIFPGWIDRLLAAQEKGQYLPNPSSCKYCSFKMICETSPRAREFKKKTFYKKVEDFDVFSELSVEDL